MKRLFKIFIVSTVLLLLSSIFDSSYTHAKIKNSFSIDGYDITVEKVNDEYVASTSENNLRYSLIYNQNSDDYQLKTEQKSGAINKILRKDIHDVQEVEIKSSTDGKIEAEVLDGKKVQGFDINQKVNPVNDSSDLQAEAPLVLAPAGSALATALIKAILATAGTIVIAGATWYSANAISTLAKKQPKIKYYTAIIKNGKVYIRQPIKSQTAAAARLKKNYDVFATSQQYALNAAKSASPTGVVKHEKHGKGSNYYWHYHGRNKQNTKSVTGHSFHK